MGIDIGTGSERLVGLSTMDTPHVAEWYDKGTDFKVWWRVIARRILALGSHDARVLDIACGPGHLLMMLASLEPRLQLTGLDISPNMLSIGRNKIEKKDLEGTMRLVEGSCYDMPLEDDSFDLVVNTMALHMMDDAPSFFEEMARVLKPGGTGYVYAFRRDPSFAGAWWFNRFLAMELKYLKKRYGVDEGTRHVVAASYTPIEVEGFLKDLAVSDFSLKITRFSMTILLHK